ncbi:MAG: MltA domain-containing protein [Rhodoferax sp.]|nr:MltA domain-containing protein [Rhodoferax sp.]
MVHQMMPINSKPAPRASKSKSVISSWPGFGRWITVLLSVGILSACGSTALRQPPAASASIPVPPSTSPPASTAPSGSGVSIKRGKSRWTPVEWSELPGFEEDNLYEAWNAWRQSCQRPAANFAASCADVRRLSIASASEQRDWLRQHFQPHRLESLRGESSGLLTGYFEPLLEASRVATAQYSVPIYQPPQGLGQRKPWYSRQDIDTLPEAQLALRDRVIAYVADPVDVLVLQIQGSGRLRLQQDDGSTRLIRVAFAATNEQPYRSVGRWLLDQGAVKDASWPGIRAWLAQNPQRQQELLWSNPRVVFFREEPLSTADAAFGPKGAQGVALTPGRSIAVDPESIPYGTPVWLVSQGSQTRLQRLVLAQDTGSAVTGAVRADYFAGWGTEAQELAGRLRQPLQLWVLWPR